MRFFPHAALGLLIGQFVVGCSGGQGLSGISKTGKGTANKSKSGTSETLGTEQAGTETNSKDGSKRSGTVEDQGTEEALKVIPPESISGAYLTCEGRRGDPSEQTSSLDYGCAAMTKLGARLSLAGSDQTWTLKDKQGNLVDADILPLPADDRYDILWRLKKRVELSKLRPKVTLPGGSIEANSFICTVAPGGLLSEFHTCVDLTDQGCEGCRTGVLRVTDMTGDPMSDYDIEITPVSSNTGLCSGTPQAATIDDAKRSLGGIIKIDFSYEATTSFCVQVKAQTKLKSFIGGIID